MSCPFIYVRNKRGPTIRTFVMVDDILANPPLYTARNKPQVVQQLAVPSIHSDHSGITTRARARPGRAQCHVHRQNVAALLWSIPSCYSPEASICADVYSVALIVPVRAL